MVFSAKLGFALVVAVASNVSLFSVLLYPKGSSSTPPATTTTPAVFPATATTAFPNTDSSSGTYRDAHQLREEAASSTDSRSSSENPQDYTTTATPPKELSEEYRSFPANSHEKTTTKESYIDGVNSPGKPELSELDDEGSSSDGTFHPTTTPSVDGIPERRFDHNRDRNPDVGPEKQFTTRTVIRNTDSPNPESEQQDIAPAPGKVEELKPQEISIKSKNEIRHSGNRRDNQKAESRKWSDPAFRNPKSQTATEKIPESGTTHNNLDMNPKFSGKEIEVLQARYERTSDRHTTSTTSSAASPQDLNSTTPKPKSQQKGDVSHESFVQQSHPRPEQQRDAFDGWDSRRGDVPPDVIHPSTTLPPPPPPPPQAELRPVNPDPKDDGLYSVISTLTDRELGQLHPAIVQVLIPALRSLEAVVLRELRTLREVTRHQEERLQRLEESQSKRSEVTEAVKVIREEKRRIQMLNSPDEPPAQSLAQSGNRSSNASAPNAEADDHLAGPAEDSSGSGEEEMVVVLRTTVEVTTTMKMPPPTTTTPTPTRANTTERNDEMIINHIYDMYNSLSSMENKVNDLGTRLTSLAGDVYRQRSKHVPLEDKMAELGRGQKSLLMRSTMHQVTLSDLEQFKNKAKAVLGPAESRVDQLDRRLEIFTDRMMDQQDEVAIMNDVYTRLEQMSQELRSSDGFKAHDVTELKRGYQQIENRLSGLQTTLDHAMGDIRYELKIRLDSMCTNNKLQC